MIVQVQPGFQQLIVFGVFAQCEAEFEGEPLHGVVFGKDFGAHLL